MSHQFIFIGIAIVCGLFAATLRTIKRNLIAKPASQFRPKTVRIFAFFEWLFWLACVVALAISAPHPVTFVLLAMLMGTLLVARRWTYLDEAESLNRWMRLAAGTRASYPVLAESLANGSTSRIACQAKSFSARLMRGESLVKAVRRSKLPVSADTLAAIQHAQPQSTAASAKETSRFEDIDATTPASAPIIAEQFIYLLATMFLAWGMGSLFRSNLIELFDEFGDEFVSTRSSFGGVLQTITTVYEAMMIVLSIWFLMAILIRWQPTWLIRWIPWFGKDAIERWRCEILRSLAIGIRAGNAEPELLSLASQSSRVPWIRNRCRKASRLIENGTTLPDALHRSRVVTSKEQTWLTSAAGNHHLPSAINQLVDNLTRRRSLRWKLRMSWLVPLGTVLVGVYVMAHIMAVFLFLTTLTQALS
ncbi:protein secretion system [Rhodopirellula islandica]|uniref:Protein secretion system n=1 Tax=Rhodopirellula islandica TaxID=595434 RepID=A0A0J1B458_RHOIS|nr:type II secretion system F family protein [Rhodopirellula islandica]KLU01640.1 protein secretion system [Rhodopirellula islandica]